MGTGSTLDLGRLRQEDKSSSPAWSHSKIPSGNENAKIKQEAAVTDLGEEVVGHLLTWD